MEKKENFTSARLSLGEEIVAISDELLHCTVRLECARKDGTVVTGTGFFFSFKSIEGKHVPVIVTNKHVIKDSAIGKFVLTHSDGKGKAKIGSVEKIVLDKFEERWAQHEEDQVDLAILPIGNIINELKVNDIQLHITYLHEDLIPPRDEMNSILNMTEVTMIGYPNGIWDPVNNIPIVRRGSAATPPKIDYRGAPIFLIDCACFPGSSGSPVCAIDLGEYYNGKGERRKGPRIALLGVLFAGPQHTIAGEIKTIDLPFAQTPISLAKIPNNLGFVIKAHKINEFRPRVFINR